MIRAAVILGIAIAVIAVSVLVGSALLGRRLSSGELVIVLLSVAFAVACWGLTTMQRRQARRRLRDLRDSALW